MAHRQLLSKLHKLVHCTSLIIAMPQIIIRTVTSSNYFCIPLTYGDLKTRDDQLVHCEYMHENADHDL